MNIRVGLIGLGRIGKPIARQILQAPGMDLVMAICSPNSDKEGKDLGEILDIMPVGVTVKGNYHLEELLTYAKPDVVVDFTTPESAMTNLKLVASKGAHLVVGTTGFTRAQVRILEKSARQHAVSLVMAPNLSLGINVLINIARKVAQVLNEFDVEIIEEHHRYKKDAPSGTAIRIGRAVADEMGLDPDWALTYGYHDSGERLKDKIAIHSVRGGGIVGVHKIIFVGDNERLEIRHESLNRKAFTDCLQRIIRFVAANLPGMYDVEEILGLEEKTEEYPADDIVAS